MLLVLNVLVVLSQSTNVVHRSDYRHDYLVSRLEYLEEAKDTSRLKYIATVTVKEEQRYLLQAAGWFTLLKLKAKEVGANTFLVQSYEESSIDASLTVRMYFASEKFLKENRLKQKMNAVFVFNQTRYQGEHGRVYIEKKAVDFNSKEYYVFATELGHPYYVGNNESAITEKKILFKKSSPSRFLIVPANKDSFVFSRSTLSPAETGFSINGVPATFYRNTPYELNYDTGRFLLAVYH